MVRGDEGGVKRYVWTPFAIVHEANGANEGWVKVGVRVGVEEG